MVYVPSAPTEPSPAPSYGFAVDAELNANRRNTSMFIAQDPIDLVLYRSQTGRSSNGARIRLPGRALPEQRMKLIMISPAGGSLDQTSEDGRAVVTDYVLLCEWDADIRSGDYWEDENGHRFEVTSLVPTNSYEIRANVTALGDGLEGG